MRVKRKTQKYIAIFLALTILNFSGAQTVFAIETKFNMSYIYFTDTSTYTDYIDRTQDSLNEISPGCFELNADGSLKINISLSSEFIEDTHNKGIKIVPFLSNGWDRTLGRAALANSQQLSQQIADVINASGLDGINVDLENLNEADRDAYTNFVKLLSEKLILGKTIAVAVAANPNADTTGWQGSYDYKGLAKYSNYLMIMTYDEHYQGSDAGTIAGAPFIEKSIKYALSMVDKTKIVLGIPFYGRIWKNGGGSPNGNGISLSKIDDLIEKYNGKVTFDYTSCTPYATITIKLSDVKPVIGGKQLSAGTYTIWYENEQSIKYKLTIVEKYDIMGTGSWSLGQEEQDTWDYYKLWLSGCYFNDIQTHWAKDAILNGYMNNWIKGVSNTLFMPDECLTRAQAAVMLVRLLGLPVQDLQTATFNDTQGHWAMAQIETAREYGIISGIGDNMFAPDEPVTREQMAVMLDNLKLKYSDSDSGRIFYDVNPDSNPWSYEAIASMSLNGIIEGYPDGSFHPNEELTRAEMTVMMQRASKYAY